MGLSWKRKNMFRRANKAKDQLSGGDGDLTVDEVTIPTHFRCPVSLDLMKDPVTLPTGITYDRLSIEKWVESGNRTCPVTNQKLSIPFEITPNHTIRKMIQNWCVENISYGVERIPTPRIPVSSFEVSEVCMRLLSASKNVDEKNCVGFVEKMKSWWRESERNKRVIIGNGVCSVLAIAFDSFSCVSIENHVVVLEEILEILTWIVMSPFGESKGKSKICLSSTSLNCLVWFLDGKDLGARQNAVLLLKETSVEELSKVEGVVEGLVKIVKEPIGSSAKKACLVTIFKLVSSSKNRVEISEKIVELGLVSFLLETIVECEKGVCEKALGVLECLCDCEKGKEVVKINALTLPLVIKKILRVSPLASSFAVGIVRKMCEKKEEEILIEVIQLGAFQKLLVMLQVGCEEKTKENATELLKLLNGFRSKAECVDSSMDFKYLKN